MYASRGYRSTPLAAEQQPTRITLVASEFEDTIGTITVGFDSPQGLHVDDLFLEETDGLRDAGRRICEFTKLAMDSVVRSKRVLASLFHVAYIYGYRMMDYDDLLIEVNPRHVLFYQRMLGFKPFGPEKICPRVNAPAILLRLDLDFADEQIILHGGMGAAATGVKTIYPYFFTRNDELGITQRLLKGE